MAVNHQSGRIVVELDPKLKTDLHATLAAQGLSLKAWVTWCAERYVEDRRQGRLQFDSSPDAANGGEQ